MSVADKLNTVSQNIPKVYEAGKQAQYDDFWNNYLHNHCGQFMFAGEGWDENTCKPPKGSVIKPTYPYMMFAGTGIEDIPRWCNDNDITLDFSKATTFIYVFYNSSSSSLKHIGELNTTNVTALTSTFSGLRSLYKIDNMILRDNGTQTMSSAFQGCEKLQEISLVGAIGNNLDMHWSTLLNKESITNIVNTLYASATGKTLTLSLTAVNNAFQTAEGLADGSTSAEWIELITPKSNQYDGNWSISLV